MSLRPDLMERAAQTTYGLDYPTDGWLSADRGKTAPPHGTRG